MIQGLENELGWDKSILAVMGQTPPQSVVDYKIMWRNPNPKWVSPGGLIVQLGDSAHSFLPTSANGATQAMEDGISLAACLKLAGKNNIVLATRVHTALRSVFTTQPSPTAKRSYSLIAIADSNVSHVHKDQDSKTAKSGTTRILKKPRSTRRN